MKFSHSAQWSPRAHLSKRAGQIANREDAAMVKDTSGKRIGSDRAEYGKQIIKRLSLDLTRQFGKGFSRQNLQQMRAFYIDYADKQICQTPYGILEKTNDVQIQQISSV